MARSKEVVARRQERHMRRRNQILDAARTCVRAEGFHGASMSRISAEASMGVGNIYKYFDTKEAIMIALTERDFEEFMLHFVDQEEIESLSIDAIVDRYLNDVPWILDYDRAALAIEVLAEAARNPKVEELVAHVDSFLRNAIRKMVAPALRDLSATEIDVRVEMMLIMTRALVLHAGTHPRSDPQIIAPGFALALRGVLAPSQ